MAKAKNKPEDKKTDAVQDAKDNLATQTAEAETAQNTADDEKKDVVDAEQNLADALTDEANDESTDDQSDSSDVEETADDEEVMMVITNTSEGDVKRCQITAKPGETTEITTMKKAQDYWAICKNNVSLRCINVKILTSEERKEVEDEIAKRLLADAKKRSENMRANGKKLS